MKHKKQNGFVHIALQSQRYSRPSAGLIGLFLNIMCGVCYAANPSTITLTLQNQTGLGANYEICMIGYSQAGSVSGASVAAMWLNPNGSFVAPPSGVQSSFSATNITLSYTSADPSTYINSARINYYIVNRNDPIYSACSDLTYTIDSSGKITYLNTLSAPFPNSGLFEFTLDVAGIHADTSNVDNFQAPINAAFYDNSNKFLGEFGQPVGAENPNNLVNQQDIIASYAGWIASQPDPNRLGVGSFSVLLNSNGQGMINGPTAYLTAKGVVNGNANTFLHPYDPLNKFFDNALNALYLTEGLKIRGDQIGNPVVYPEQYYTLTNAHATCPWTVATSGHAPTAAQFSGDDGKTVITLCNPVGMTYATLPDPSGIQTAITVKQVSANVFTVAPIPPQSMLGMYMGQPDTGFYGTVVNIDNNNGQVTLSNAVNSPNVSFPTWMFSIIMPSFNGVGLTQFESSAAMVFGGDGAFNDGKLQSNDSNMQQLLSSVERNINEAMNRGVANCNNITACPNMTGGSDTRTLWGTESNWYPAGGAQNYYAQFLHTVQFAMTNISLPLNGAFTLPTGCAANPVAVQKSNQGISMGMVYGFAYDENSDYLGACVANVPSKWDPAPASTAKIIITMGSWLSASAGYLFNWAESTYGNLFSPQGAPTQYGIYNGQYYTYRYYPNTRSFLGVSTTTTNNHVYYMGPNGGMQDEGALSQWLLSASNSSMACVFNWAESSYSSLFSPSGAATQSGLYNGRNYTYRYYPNTHSYLGVASANNELVYMGPNGILQDEGPLFSWAILSGCP